MITHPGARTRAIYDWERQDLDHRPGVKPISEIEGYWLMMALVGAPVPQLTIKDMKQVPYYLDGMIVLTKNDHDNLTLIHELAHYVTKTRKNHHNVKFVKNYIWLMNQWFGWDEDILLIQARDRGLV